MKRNIWQYLKRYKFSIGLYLFLYVIGTSCNIFNTILSANMIEKITLGAYTQAIMTAVYVIGLIVLARLIWWCCSLVYQNVSSKLMMDLNYDLSLQAFKLNTKTYADHGSGVFVNRILNDPQNTIGKLSNIVDIVASISSNIIIFVYVTTLNFWIGLCLFVLTLIASLLEYFRVRIRTKNQKLTKEKYDKVQSLTNEIVKSEKDIKSTGLEEKLAEISRSAFDDYRTISNKASYKDIHLSNLRSLISGVCSMGILILGITLIDKALITVSTFMIVYSNRGSIFNLTVQFGRIGNIVSDIKISSTRMFELFDEKEFVTEKFGTVDLDISGGGQIEFKNVGYTYYEYDYKNSKKGNKKKVKVISENHIFDDLSFKIEPNTTVAFIGKSGSGKSTILNLATKMFEAEKGEVLFNDINIKDLSKKSLRKSISLVNQFPYIFDMTIKENLLLANKTATDEDIQNALKDACLDEFISTLPKGLDTKVGESGIKLSGGQKQRLAIARALLRNSNVIIFDESTSSLDNIAQAQVKRSIDNLKGKTTVIIVAHRLSTIKDVDTIFFLDEGKILDEGTFDELFEKNEKFKTMFLAENI